jgi:hypothetical protein
MGLLTPAFLVLGAAIAVPLILHLFQRHQGPRVVFPALRYLRRAETEHARRIKLRQLLLMLLRVAALALLALAAARPFIRAAGAGHQPTAVAIVLDNSMSTSVVTGDVRLLDELKNRALETLDAAEPEDVFWLIRAGAPWEPAWPGDARATAARITETEASSAAADLRAAVERARAVLQAGAGNRAAEIHLLSDLQASNLTGASAPVQNAPVMVSWVARGDPPVNVAVADVDVGGGVAPIAGQRSTVAALLAGSASTDSVSVRMALEGRVIAAATAPVGSATILPFPARPTGFVGGWVEKDPDALRPDDRRWFATRVGPPPTVAVGGPMGLVEDALAVLESAGRIRRAPLREAEVALLPAGRGIEGLPPALSVIIVAPDSLLELQAVNRRLGAAGIRWTLEPPAGSGVARFDPVTLGDGPLRTLDQVRLSAVFRLTPPGASADTVLLRLTDGTPWAVRGNRPGGGRFVLLGSPLSEQATTLPTSPALLPLLDRLLGPWIAARSAVTEASPGDEIALPDGATSVMAPDSLVEPATPGYRLGALPGLYRVLAGDSVLSVIAVNAPAIESDLRRANERRLREAFPGADIVTADRPEAWSRQIFQQRVGREVWRPLALIALIVLLVETLVAATGARRAAARVHHAAPPPTRAPTPRETQAAGG